MNKLSVFEIDAHVCHFSARFPATEKYQITFPKISPGNFTALFLLTVCASLQFDMIYLFNLLLFTVLVIGLSGCRTSAPKLDYKKLARASVRLGVDIGMEDNHKLYLEAAEWIGTPYRGGGETKRGTDCSGMTCQIYKKVFLHTFILLLH